MDTNDGFFAVRRLDAHGNPAGAPHLIPFDLAGTSGRGDAQVRHALTRLVRYCHRFSITTLAIEDLGFDDARAAGRETMGRGQRGKQFRRTVAGIPTAVIRNRLTAMAHRAGITLVAVNPANTCLVSRTRNGQRGRITVTVCLVAWARACRARA